ncbi:MAG TPA: hypothetical protein VFJ65_09120 [Solirubrobacterales bacterium]|nr:hypothetical protein [Solirubrobacterales bacterium]
MEEARASPPAAPATAAPPATNGSFALLMTVAFFIAFGLRGFEDDFARFGADRFFGLVFV